MIFGEFIALHKLRSMKKRGVAIPKAGDFYTEKFGVLPIEQVDDRVVRFTISTSTVDRQKDKVDVNGWDLTNYKRNPVVLWGHDARALKSLVGRCVEIGVVDNALKAAVEFVPKEVPAGVGDEAEAVLWLLRNKFLSATSVGFQPIKWEFTEDKERGADDWFPGIDFQAQELLEFSVVSIPANPEALIEPDAIANDPPPSAAAEIAAAALIAQQKAIEQQQQIAAEQKRAADDLANQAARLQHKLRMTARFISLP